MNIQQLTISFDQPAGQRLAEVGCELAIETANAEFPKWSERCWKLFWQWLNRKPKGFEFLVEDFRRYLQEYDLLELPKSNRAFGMVSKKALKEGLILFNGMGRVTNRKAHNCFASKWIKI